MNKASLWFGEGVEIVEPEFYPYKLNQSLKFNDDDSAYLSRTPDSAGNRRTWTWSGWVKRGNIGTNQVFFSAGYNVNNTGVVRFDSGDTITFHNFAGTDTWRLTTTSLYRDPSAFYHVVAVCDTTNTTSKDRVRLYVNGERVTDFNTETQPALNAQGYVNSTNLHTHGNYAGNSSMKLDAYLSEVHFIDGEALDADSFGEFKEDIWIPKEYSGNYGQNGYYLPFKGEIEAQGFNAVTYTGTNSNESIDNVGLRPGLVWIKARGLTQSPNLFDSVRGGNSLLRSTSANEEFTSTYLTFDSNGFSFAGNDPGWNSNGQDYVAWCWSAGDTETNTVGDITSVVAADTEHGFSIVTYTGNGLATNQTIGHGLNSAPEMVIVKARTGGAAGWAVYNKDIGENLLELNSNADILGINENGNDYGAFGDPVVDPSDSDFTVRAATNALGTNRNGSNFVAYCWHSVEGYSKIGSYTGNGGNQSIDIGFKPRFIMFRDVSSGGSDHDWLMVDTARNPTNPVDGRLYANLQSTEGTDSNVLNISDNGFDLTGGWDDTNTNGRKYIYMAFADTQIGGIGDDAKNIGETNNHNDFKPITYTGNGATDRAITGLGFKPALVWGKERSAPAESHWLYDSVRGATMQISSNSTNAESVQATGVKSFDTDGFTVGNDTAINNNNETYVAWCWRAPDSENITDNVSITNGDFATGDFTGWEIGGTITPTIVSGGARLDEDVSLDGSIAQDVTTIVGVGYTVSWDITSNVGGSFGLFINGTLVLDQFTVDGSHTFTADSTTTEIEFRHRYDGYGVIDNISISSNLQDSTVHSNKQHGFSIVSYTGSSSVSTVGHGLNSEPEMLIIKNRDQADKWAVYHASNTSAPETDFLSLNESSATVNSTNYWNDTAPTTTVFTVGQTGPVNQNNEDYICYAFHSVPGYSDFGSYSGTGSSGNSVNLGFRPSFVMIKRTDSTGNWGMYDSVRSPSNPVDDVLTANTNNAEGVVSNALDFTDTGFTIGTANGDLNANNGDYIYMAFADTDLFNDNDWTPVNLDDDDALPDSPTNNFTTMNPLFPTDNTFSEGNLQVLTSSPDEDGCSATQAVSSGKYYWEVRCNAMSDNNVFFIGINNVLQNNINGSYSYYGLTGNKYDFTISNSAYGSSYTVGDIISVALNMDDGELTFYKNGVSQGVAFSSISGTYSPWLGDGSGGKTVTYVANFGQDSTFNGNEAGGVMDTEYTTFTISGHVPRVYDDSQRGINWWLGDFGATATNTARYQSFLTALAAAGYGTFNGTNTFTMNQPINMLGTSGNIDGESLTFGGNGHVINGWAASHGAYLDLNLSNAADGNWDTLLTSSSQSFDLRSIDTEYTTGGNPDSNGVGEFYYRPPEGFLALCSANLPDPGIDPNQGDSPQDHYNTVLWTGNGSDDRNITGVGFAPDFVWVKNRSTADFNLLFDKIRGVGKKLYSNSNEAEYTDLNSLQAFESDGYEIGTDTWMNTSGESYVAWNWKAGGTGVANTDGSISSTVSANTDAGFSIVAYTGNGDATETVGHGLSKAPDMYIVKERSANTDPPGGWNQWLTYHKDVGNTHALYLDGTFAQTDTIHFTNDTSPTDSVFTIAFGSKAGLNATNKDYIAYCFHEVEGYSKFGSYTGNGSADGPFVYTGFRPAFVMVKRIDSTGNWQMLDNTRDPDNVANKVNFANGAAAEVDNTDRQMDLLSNGFKLRQGSQAFGEFNTSGGEYIYMAFAEQPFKYSNAR